MKTTSLLFLLIFSLSSFAQRSRYLDFGKNQKNGITTVDHVVYSLHFEDLKTKVFEFILTNNIPVNYQEDKVNNLYISIIADAQQKISYDSLLNKYGHTTSKEMIFSYSNEKLESLDSEIRFLEKKNASYIILLAKLDEKSENYMTVWQENKSIEDQLFQKNNERKKIIKNKNKIQIDLHLINESNSPEYTEVSFVNMPGFEYSILRVETPKEGFSSQYYQGYFLKYLFTQGKSFFELGAYKSTDTKSDSLQFSEMFIIGFGQDFYSRLLGRGSNKFFNLYSGYSLGGVLSTGNGSNYYDFYIAPSIGLEIFKTEYILIDTKLSYFVPIANNKSQRGLTLSASFNFMF